jgi:hypothetical protein
MTPKALVISCQIDWDGETCGDVMVTFVTGENPVDAAHNLIESISGDFPGYTHKIIANPAAAEARKARVTKALGMRN